MVSQPKLVDYYECYFCGKEYIIERYARKHVCPKDRSINHPVVILKEKVVMK